MYWPKVIPRRSDDWASNVCLLSHHLSQPAVLSYYYILLAETRPSQLVPGVLPDALQDILEYPTSSVSLRQKNPLELPSVAPQKHDNPATFNPQLIAIEAFRTYFSCHPMLGSVEMGQAWIAVVYVRLG